MKLFNLGLPKSGTTSLHELLNGNNITSSHWKVNKNETGRAKEKDYVAQVIYDNHLNNKKIFDGFEKTIAISQCDVCLPQIGLNLWPQFDQIILEKIINQYPKCKLLLLKRSPKKVISSIRKWNDLYMRIVISDISGLPSWEGSDDNSLLNWINWHYKSIEKKFLDYENFLSVDIESKDSIKILYDFLEIDIESSKFKEWPISNVTHNRPEFSADLYWISRELSKSKNKEISLNKTLFKKDILINSLEKELKILKDKFNQINDLCD